MTPQITVMVKESQGIRMMARQIQKDSDRNKKEEEERERERDAGAPFHIFANLFTKIVRIYRTSPVVSLKVY